MKTKLITVITIALFGSATLNLALIKTISDKDRAIKSLRVNLDSRDRLIVQMSDTITGLRDYEVKLIVKAEKKGEFLRYFRVGSRYSTGFAFETNLPMDRDHLRRLYTWAALMDSAEINDEFWVNTIFYESRAGTNINHKPNKNGTTDGGWSGINSFWGNYDDDVYKTIEIFNRKNLAHLDLKSQLKVWRTGKLYESRR